MKNKFDNKVYEFRKAYEKLDRCFRRDPTSIQTYGIKNFVIDLKEAGFLTCWGTYQFEKVIALVAIKRSIEDKIGFRGGPYNQTKVCNLAKEKFDWVRKMYNDEIGIVDIDEIGIVNIIIEKG